MIFFLAFDLSGTYTGRRSHAEESIPARPDALAVDERSFFRNERVPKYVPQVLSKYGLPHHFQCSPPHPFVPSENLLSTGCSSAYGASLWAGSFSRRACLRLPTSHDHLLAVAHWRARSDFARALLSRLQLPHLQLDELRTRLCSTKQVLWLWLAIDPLTKIIPVLQLGPRTQIAAQMVIHSLRQILAPGCLPLFTSDGLNLYFYALTAHFGQWLKWDCRGQKA